MMTGKIFRKDQLISLPELFYICICYQKKTMYQFEFHNPVKILFGKGQIAKLREEINRDQKILLTYGGGSIFGNGVYRQVMDALEGYDIHEFGGIEPNPMYETLMKAVEKVKKEQIGFLLAVGGGSVLDGTKFIAAAAKWEEGDPWDFVTGESLHSISEAVPMGTVLTLPATGSEMNATAVISRGSTSEKLAFASPHVMPLFSVLDPETVFSLPDRQVANGIADAFVHVIEQYLTFDVNTPLQDRLSESILLTLIEEGPKVLHNRTDYDAAANFMWCATLALNGLIGKGVPEDWATHQIGHELTAFHGIDHARTLAIVLPGIMNIYRSRKQKKLLQYAGRIWGITEGSTGDIIDAAIARTIRFFESIGIQCRLRDYGVPTETIDKIEERFQTRNEPFGEYKDIDGQAVRKILEDRQ
jgi:NADP-dependent alcohol dehydrogenase